MKPQQWMMSVALACLLSEPACAIGSWWTANCYGGVSFNFARPKIFGQTDSSENDISAREIYAHEAYSSMAYAVLWGQQWELTPGVLVGYELDLGTVTQTSNADHVGSDYTDVGLDRIMSARARVAYPTLWGTPFFSAGLSSLRGHFRNESDGTRYGSERIRSSGNVLTAGWSWPVAERLSVDFEGVMHRFGSGKMLKTADLLSSDQDEGDYVQFDGMQSFNLVFKYYF